VLRTLIGGDAGTVLYDGLDSADSVKVYESAGSSGSGLDERMHLRIGYRASVMRAPQLAIVEPLREVIGQFVESIRTGSAPHTDGASALRIIRYLEAADRSLASQGRRVALRTVTCP
jgi:predicted dehydrogenase